MRIGTVIPERERLKTQKWLRQKMLKKAGSSKYQPHQGAQEMARRRRQAEKHMQA
jgi:hypothetical protein